MPVTINGTTGIAGVAGSASTPAVQGTDSNTGVFYPAADTVAIATNGTEAMRVDSSQNVGIGTSSPQAKLDVSGNVFTRDASFPAFKFANSSGTALAEIYYGVGAADLNIVSNQSSGRIVFQANGSERARITSGGDLLVGATSPWNNVARFFAYQPTSASNAIVGQLGTSSGSTFVGVNSSGSATFYVTVAGQIAAVSTSITGISDGRLKTNIQPIKYGLSDVLKLKPVIFDFIENDLVTGQKDNLGFVAQDVQPIIPELVNESQSKAEDQTPYLTLKMGDLLPVLVKAIQEQQALITSLTARIAALEGAAQ